MSSRCPHNMVNFGPLAAEIVSLVWGTNQISTGFASWQRYCTCTACSSGRQPSFAALNRGRHLCWAGRPSRWALTHILVLICCVCVIVRFLRRAAMLALQALYYGISVRLSVRLSVCPSHAGIVSKQLHVSQCSLHCQIAKCV